MDAAIASGSSIDERGSDERKRKRDGNSDGNEEANNTQTPPLADTSNSSVPIAEVRIAAAAAEESVDPALTVAPAAAAPFKVGKKSFFEMLKAQEAKAPPLGTVHAKGAKNNASGDKGGREEENKVKLPCFKCTTYNEKYAEHCVKCRALKRMT